MDVPQILSQSRQACRKAVSSALSLFLLYINDLPDCISSQTTTKLFADDCLLYRKIQSQDDANKLQEDLDSLQKPVLEYGCEVWDPFTKDNTRKLEMVQRRYARFTMGDHRRTSSVTVMLRQLHWPTLEEKSPVQGGDGLSLGQRRANVTEVTITLFLLSGQAFDQFDVDGEGQAYVESMLDALRSSNGANLRGELSHAIRILTACTLTPGLIDVFSSERESVGQHGQRILKYLLRNRAPSSALPYPSLDGFSHTTTMRLSVLDQHLQEKQRQSAFRDSFELEGGGEVKLTTKCFKSIQVSTNPREASRLTDGDPSTYWQSDGPAHTHWVRFKLRPGVCLKHLSVQVARGDHSYMPQHVTVLTGHSPVSLQEVTEVRIPSHITGDVPLLENAKVIRPYVQISIKRCQFEGCDVRVHGIRALGYKMVQKSEVSVKDASAMWYLSVLASTANAAIPIAPHLRSAILNHTKMALSHMPPLSLMPQQLSKASFLSPHVLDQVAEFLHNIARNERGELEMEGLKILLEFALARGNLASILKALQDLLDHKNSEIEGAVKMLRNLNTVRDSILKKHGTQLTMTLEGCDGGQQDESTAPSNVLCGNWSAKGMTSRHLPTLLMDEVEVPLDQCFVGQYALIKFLGPRSDTATRLGIVGVQFYGFSRTSSVLDNIDISNVAPLPYDVDAPINTMVLFTQVMSFIVRICQDLEVMKKRKEGTLTRIPVPDMQHLTLNIISQLYNAIPQDDTATRLGIVGVQFYGFSRTSSVLDNIDISNVAPLPYDVDAPINTMVLFTQVMSFIVRICQDLEVMKKRKEGTLTRIPVPDMQHLTLNIISQLYNAIPQDDNRWVYARILCLNLLHISIPNLAKLREKETAKARILSNLQLQDHPKLGELHLHGSQTQETQSDTQPPTDTQTSQDTPTQEMLANVPSQGEPSRGEQRGDAAEGQQTAPVQESQNTQHQESNSGQTPETEPSSSTPPPMAIPGTSSPMLDSKELDTSLDQRQARELFNHLCQLVSFDGGDGSQDDPRMLLKAAAEGCILDGAAVFFPGKEARREELFNMMNSMVTGEDTAVGLVFQSLCRFFSTVDPSGLLELPSSSQEEFNQGSVLMVFDTLLSASYKEFVELIEDGEEASPPSAPSHVCSLLCALQTSLLGWAKHCLTDSKGDSKLKKTAGDVIRDYCGMQCSWTRNALCLLQGQKGINNRFNDLIHTFIPTAFRQMVLCVTLLSEMDLPYLHLAQRLLSVAVEIRQLETKLNIHFPKDGSPVQCSAKEDVVILRKWHIESAHNYDNNQHVTQIFTCPGADLFEVTFDSKCETERRYDYLEFTDSKGETLD
nr:zinc finger ZZ-type and EF-hand domain-containing protein 1-like [Lytechinus pictus]